MLADDWELLACSPGKAFVEPGAGRHRAVPPGAATAGDGRDGAAPRRGPAVPDAWRPPRAWLSDVDPLADRLDGRDDLRAFARPTRRWCRELRLVLHALPARPRAPGPGGRHRPRRSSSRCSGRCSRARCPGCVLQDCRAEVVRYGRDGCVLRYELAWRLQPSRRSLKQVVYGKVYGDDRGRLVGPARDRPPAARPDGSGSVPAVPGAPFPGLPARPAAGAPRGGARIVRCCRR